MINTGNPAQVWHIPANGVGRALASAPATGNGAATMLANGSGYI